MKKGPSPCLGWVQLHGATQQLHSQRELWKYVLQFQELTGSWIWFIALALVDFRQFKHDLRG